MAVTVRTSAPGKLMLMGEHAVLHGRRALVAAVDQRFTVALSPRVDRNINITSSLGDWQGSLSTLRPTPPFTFVLQAIVQAAPVTGFDLSIRSSFREDIGLGSSAAVTVATVAALHCLTDNQNASPGESWLRTVFNDSLTVVRAIQGRASGADLAAAVYGGVIAYRSEPLEIQGLSQLPPLVAVYSGSKRKTAEVIALVETARQREPRRFEEIFDAMEACTESARQAIEREDWATFGKLLDKHQDLMQAIGVSNAKLETMIRDLRRDPGIHGAKISGAGLGDCVIAAGTPADECGALDLELSAAGLRVETGLSENPPGPAAD